MEIIDRYVYAVVKRLPEKSRADVEEELRANIEDMLPVPYDEADVHKVLLSLGNPAALAEQYRETKRYLISPELYGSYIYVLRIVALIALITIPVASFFTVLTDSNAVGALEIGKEIFVESIRMAFPSMLSVFASVTLIFAFLDRADKKYSQWPYTGKPWTIRDLEGVPASHTRSIGRIDPIVSIVFGVVFGVGISFFSQLSGRYTKVNGDWIITPLFNEETIRVYVPFLLALTAFGVIVAALKLIHQQWNTRLAWINALYNLCNAAFVCAFMLNPDLFSEAFVSAFASDVDQDPDSFIRTWDGGVSGVTALIVLTMLWDAVSGFLKAKKLAAPPNKPNVPVQ